MKRKFVFLSLMVTSFYSYTDNIVLPSEEKKIEDSRLNGIDKYTNNAGTDIVIDKDNEKNLTASIINYKNYSEINNIPFDWQERHKPVININGANGKEISYTAFKKMDVGVQGVYLNNKNLNKPASIIITEINGNEVTKLAGKLGILGKKAELIVVNPNGIECSGCGFSQTNKVTLHAGDINFVEQNNIFDS